MRATLSFRLARSAAFAAVSVLLAMGAHWFAGGGGPTTGALLTGLLAVTAGAAVAAGRERPPQVIVVLLVGAQAFLHLLFDVTASTGAPAHLTWHGGLTTRTGMLTAHLTAALLTGLWLSRGEEALWSVLRRIGAGAARCLTTLAALTALLRAGLAGITRPRVRATPGPARALRPAWVLRHAVVRRGPPVSPVF
ncbi:MFS transporter [Microbispora sp. NBC_01189]|uniref:MFS transporter n=1 Tax=Microbispora sp. NBC_01189 TaxID=2903583 RepID=UPI002E1074DC|nr:MFS transporter [Microbispora sp. NBC_01189]